MANEIQKRTTMSSVLASNGIKELGNNLSLTREQKQRAASTALSLSSNANLQDCDPFSLAKYCFETAKYNFTRDDCCYPVPFMDKSGVKKVQTQMGYRGFRELAMRSGKYSNVDASLVLSCDKVVRNRETGEAEVIFEEDYNKTIGATVIGYFAYAKDNDRKLVNSLYMTKEQCEKHGRRYSKSYKSLWGANDDDFNKMAKKTVIKQLCNQLSTTPELKNALELDQLVMGRENEKDEYLDSKDSMIMDEIKQSTVRNTIDEVDNVDEVEEVEVVEDPVQQFSEFITQK